MPCLRGTPLAALLRRSLAGLLLIAMGGGLAQCDRDRRAIPVPDDVPEAVQTPAPTPAGPVTTPTLDRAGLIGAAARAASAYASGQVTAGTDPLVGRAFSVVTPFACSPLSQTVTQGTAPDPVSRPGLANAAWGPDRETLRLTLTPGDWTGSPLLGEPQSDSGWEAVEGFWLARPWLATSDCPAVARTQLPVESGDAAGQTVGLAAVFEKDASRLARRNGRAYSFTVRPSSEVGILAWPAQGYRVVIEGRIAAFPDGRAFRCRAASPDQRPVCIAAISLDRVAFSAADGEVLSEWRSA